MARYQYAGPGPIEVLSGGEIIRPGDIREYEEEPTWGPWELIEEATHGTAGTQAGVEADAQAAAQAAAPAAPAAAVPLTPLSVPPITPKGF